MLKDTVEQDVNEEPKPRRYEVRDAETGEKLSGVSFILTPTGEEMHPLTDERRVSSIRVQAFYTGDPADGPGPVDRVREIIPDMARYDLAAHLLNRVQSHYLKWLHEQIEKRMEREANGQNENPTA